ncbi:MAG: prepilin-type N-terminal cleavage/methylation domain-containing protein, partial [bacterium]
MKATMKKIISPARHYRASTRPGFTFIELLFAIVVMGTMFALALVVFVGMLRFYVFAGSVRTNQENARNVLDTISRDVRFGQLIEPLDSTPSSTLCVYKKADHTVVKYEKLSGSNVINKSTSGTTHDSVPADCTTSTVTDFGTAQSVFNTRATAAAFVVTKIRGAGTTVYPGVLSVTIRLQVITGTADATGIACATKDIYCNSLTLNTAVNIR